MTKCCRHAGRSRPLRYTQSRRRLQQYPEPDQRHNATWAGQHDMSRWMECRSLAMAHAPAHLLRYLKLEFGGFPEVARRQPHVRQLSQRPTKDATDHVGCNLERPRDFGSRMRFSTAKREVQAHNLFLRWTEGLQEFCYTTWIHGHLDCRISQG